MHLSKCIINGFKSFADKVEIDFKKGFSAIVGPNGCGKSNIYEAILWVLGEQRPTSLRSSKMEEVIFSGTSSRNPVGMAEVSLFIVDEQRLLSDKSELQITRRLFRSGDSEYLLNGQQCRLKDITQLLSKVGLGKNSYAFIGQGEVNDILKAKPQDLRLMFEEAAGISEYKTQKFSTEAQLEKNNDSILRVNDLIEEIEKDCENLRVRAVQAKQHQKIQKKLKEKRSLLLVTQYKKLNTDIKHKKSLITNSLETIEDSKLLIENNESNEMLLKNKRKELFDKRQTIERELIRNESRLDSLNSRKKELGVELTDLRDTHTSLMNDLDEEKTELSGTKLNYNKKEEEKENLLKKIKTLKEEKRILTSKVSKLKENFNEKEFNLYNEKFHNLNVKISSLKQKLDSINQDKTRIKLDLEKANERKNSLEENLLNLKNETEEKKNQLNKIKFIVETSNKDKDDLITKHRSVKDEHKILDEKLYDLYQKFQISKNKLEFYQQQKEEYSGYYNGVKFLMQTKHKNSSMDYLYGPLAELISIPDKFQVSLSEILGSRSQYIVCQGAKDATKMINLLKEKRAGKASFLPLDSLKRKKYEIPQRIENDKAFLGRASEVIDFPEKIRPAVEQLLVNVLLYDDSKNVLNLNKNFNHNFMIATLEGEVFYSSGIISGGKNKGNSNQELLVRNEIIEKLVNEVKNYKDKHTKVNHKLKDTKRSLLELEKLIDEVDESIQKQIDKKDNLKVQISNNELKKLNYQERIDELNQNITSLSDRLQKLVTQESDNQRELNESLHDFKEINDKKDEYSDIYESINEYDLTLLNINSDLKIAINSLESLENLIAELNSNINNLSSRIKKKNEQIVTYINYINEKNQYISDIKDQINILQKQNQSLNIENNDCAKKLNNIDDKIEKLVLENRKLESTIEQNKNKIRELELNIASLETDLKYIEAEIYQNNINLSEIELENVETSNDIVKKLTREVNKLEKENKSLGNIDYGAIEDLERKEKRLSFLIEQKSDLLETQEKLTSLISKVDNLCINELGSTISTIRDNFKFIFQDLFRGGSADIIWELEDNIFNSGISLSVSPPGKNVKNMNQLSGGEKALTAIALLLAFAKLRDSAFCIFDEVDAALDENNNLLLVDYLREISKTSQVITITHSRHTMAHANYLYGVVMQEKGVSKVINVEMDKK